MTDDRTRERLRAWHGGDGGALDELLRDNLDWIRGHVRRRLGERLRAKEETEDFVQEAVVEMLRYGPRFVVENRAQFRTLLAKIVENVLRGRHDWFHRRRRAISKERPLGAGTVLELDPPAAGASPTTPSQHADRREHEAWLRLGLELVAPADREILVAREWERQSFAAIAEQLGVQEDAARMRFQRALARLARTAKQLRDGELDDVLGDRSGSS